jgi:hypothetical protein
MRRYIKGSGKTGRINSDPTDAKYLTSALHTVAISEWAHVRLAKIADAKGRPMGRIVCEWIEKASQAVVAACWAFGIGALMAIAWDK